MNSKPSDFIQYVLREPLFRFLLLGLAILAVDRLLTDGAAVNGSTIQVSASRQAALARSFEAEHGRAPRPEELRATLDRWIDEQVLYREALALGLDRRDVIVQRQLTQKMRFLIEDNTLPGEVTDAELQAWLDRYPERYGRAETVSFEQVFLSRGRHGGQLQATAEMAVQTLHSDPSAFVGLGDPFLTGQVVTSADAARLRREFGSGFSEALAQLPEGKWSGPVTTAFGLHLVRVTAREAFRPQPLAEVAGQVRRDVMQARREEHNRAALARLRARYQVVYEHREDEGQAG